MKVMVVRDMFIRTADENYVTARWCASNALTTDFLWLAFHSVEKYLKAALLLNGQSVLRASHGIEALFDLFQDLAGEFLPDLLTRPPLLSLEWRDLSPKAFVEHLARQGNPDNRYLVHGHDTDYEDIHRLDTLVFALRRACHSLDTPLIEERSGSMTTRAALHDNPNLTLTQGMPLDTLIRAPDTALRRAALNLNFAFAPGDYPHVRGSLSAASHTAAVDFYFFDLLVPDDPEQTADAVALGRWLLDNIQFPKALRAEIAAHLPDGAE
ncbi:MAG: hypothetical protein JWM33_482 [Caulobacteraceae bacterium]|nr:hypothetical protein [Caulobacteraceae bacterium]